MFGDWVVMIKFRRVIAVAESSWPGLPVPARPDQCCVPKACSEDLCKSSLWVAKPGNVLGSTKDECCVPLDCDDYKCSAKYVKKQKRRGAGIL